jgi:hypothetical protein
MILGDNQLRSTNLISAAFLKESGHSVFSTTLLSTLNSDFLMALALASCGLCGSIVSELRNKNNHSPNFRNAALGIAVGFITLLSIKGGKAIFFIEHRADLVTFNPYTCALLALLSGLYSGRAFLILSRIFNAGK